MSGGDLINAAISTEELEVSAAVTTEEPEVAADLDQLRWLVLRGMKGDTGKSAYALAVELGFVGTVVQWLASLKGGPGDPGAPGVSPTVTTEPITGGNRVTITDAEHPQGQSVDVMDGEKGDTGTFAATVTDGMLEIKDLSLMTNVAEVGA